MRERGFGALPRTAIIVCALAGALVSAYCILDASTFALHRHDPSTGRARGCYTRLERIAGVLLPGEALRKAQLYCGVAGMLVSLCVLGLSAARSGPRDSPADS